MGRIKNIVFDLDGTLTDTLPIIFEAFNHVIYPHTGRRYTNEEIASYFGPPEEDILRVFIPEREVDASMKRLYMYYEDNSERVQLFEGLQAVLDKASFLNIKMGLFTGKSRRGTEITLRQMGLTDFFRDTITGSDVVQPKPHPEGLVTLISAMKCNLGETLFIGDTSADIQAGAAAGVLTGLALWGTEQDCIVHPKPDFLFKTPFELLEVLDE